jgi:hypothetical protein
MPQPTRSTDTIGLPVVPLNKARGAPAGGNEANLQKGKSGQFQTNRTLGSLVVLRKHERKSADFVRNQPQSLALVDPSSPTSRIGFDCKHRLDHFP